MTNTTDTTDVEPGLDDAGLEDQADPEQLTRPPSGDLVRLALWTLLWLNILGAVTVIFNHVAYNENLAAPWIAGTIAG